MLFLLARNHISFLKKCFLSFQRLYHFCRQLLSSLCDFSHNLFDVGARENATACMLKWPCVFIEMFVALWMWLDVFAFSDDLLTGYLASVIVISFVSYSVPFCDVGGLTLFLAALAGVFSRWNVSACSCIRYCYSFGTICEFRNV